jgi:hypothetical protein
MQKKAQHAMRIIILSILLILFVHQLQSQYSHIYKRYKYELSPKKDIGVLLTHNDSLDCVEAWLMKQSDTTKTFFLFSSVRTMDVRFSPDENWLVVNDHKFSNESHIYLYLRKDIVEYEDVAVDIDKEAWDAYTASVHLKNIPPYSHRYSEFIHWANNSLSFTMKISGWARTDSVNNENDGVSDWQCTFDTKTLRIKMK